MSVLEREFAFQLRALKVPEPERQYRFHNTRKWRFDFSWPDRKLAVEIEGGIWAKGAHTRGKRFNSDAEKYNAAALAGWQVLRYTTDTVKNWHGARQVAELFS